MLSFTSFDNTFSDESFSINHRRERLESFFCSYFICSISSCKTSKLFSLYSFSFSHRSIYFSNSFSSVSISFILPEKEIYTVYWYSFSCNRRKSKSSESSLTANVPRSLLKYELSVKFLVTPFPSVIAISIAYFSSFMDFNVSSDTFSISSLLYSIFSCHFSRFSII